jgi:hypothetical protein
MEANVPESQRAPPADLALCPEKIFLVIVMVPGLAQVMPKSPIAPPFSVETLSM